MVCGVSLGDIGHILGGLFLLSLGGLLVVSNRLHVQHESVFKAPVYKSMLGAVPIHICMCTDDTDMRGLVVAMKTAVAAAYDPSKLHFHVVTSVEVAPLYEGLLQLHLPHIDVKVHSAKTLQQRLSSLHVFKKNGGVRDSLSSIFNLAPFYLHEFVELPSHIKRLIYLDTDVVVLSDLSEMLAVDMQGKSMAVVKDCLTKKEHVFDMGLIQRSNFSKSIDQSACTHQRGVFVLDIKAWKEEKLWEQIELWMHRYRDYKEPIWYGEQGLTQPSWLAATSSATFAELDPKWNCFNLGKEVMPLEAAAAIRKMGFDHTTLAELGVQINTKLGKLRPFINRCSANAAILHFSGELKPWLQHVWQRKGGSKPPICEVEQFPSGLESRAWQKKSHVQCEPKYFVFCHNLWEMHISSTENCVFRDVEKEWRGDENSWAKSFKKSAREKKAQIEEQDIQEEAKAKEKAAEKVHKEKLAFKEDDGENDRNEDEGDEEGFNL